MIILGAQASRLSFWASSATIHDCAGHHESPQSSPAFKVEDSRWSGKYKYILLSLSHIVFSHQAINSLPQPSTKPKHLQKPSSFNPIFSHKHSAHQPTQPTPHQNTMASAMYRPSFTLSTSSSNASISSKSSTTSSARAIYTRDGQGWELSTSYPSSGIETKAFVAPAFS